MSITPKEYSCCTAGWFFFSLYKCQDVTQRQTVKSSFLPGLNLGFTQLSEITRPPVCSRVFHQRQRARGERKPQNTKLFIETNSEQEGKYLVCSAAYGRRCRSSPRFKWGGTAGPLFSDRMVHSVGSLQEAQHHRREHTHSLSFSLSLSHTCMHTYTHVCCPAHAWTLTKNHNIPVLL